jgi:hypothetical protein
METDYSQAVATLVSFSTGDASFYLSSGGGVIGGGAHESVRAAAARFVAAATGFLSHLEKTDRYPLPSAGRTRFYVLTTDGIYTAEAGEEELGGGSLPLSPLFSHGHEVITELRKTTERTRR